MNVTINDNIFKVKLCMTENSIREGMSKKRFNEDFNGMLFLMGEEKEQSFWMYNCIIPLDIIFIKENKIVSIFHNCQPCKSRSTCNNYQSIADKVLEVQGGTCEKQNINQGDSVDYSLI